MYTQTEGFECDLVNDFAWNTAIKFIQEMENQEDDTKNYSIRIGKGDYGRINGTNGTDVEDKRINIYDMSGNYREWSTSTYNRSGETLVIFGGGYWFENYKTCSKNYVQDDYSKYKNVSFRPIIYIAI